MRNWYHFNWLAGDQCLQQLIHSIDKGAWAMDDEPPVKAWGIGGRAACFGPMYGDLFDHQAIVYEYANGVRMFGLCRNQIGAYQELTDKIYGTKGIAHLLKGRIEGENEWSYAGPQGNMYDVEHQELFAAIRAGKPVNNGVYMARSTMLALLGPGHQFPVLRRVGPLRLGHRTADQVQRKRRVRDCGTWNQQVHLSRQQSRALPCERMTSWSRDGSRC
jgi:hypothetical protein